MPNVKSKTNIGGLLSTIGISLSSGCILTQLTQLFPDGANIPHGVLVACWYIAVLGVVLKIVGTAMTSYFAADDSDLQQVKVATGLVAATPPVNSDPTPTTPAKP